MTQQPRPADLQVPFSHPPASRISERKQSGSQCLTATHPHKAAADRRRVQHSARMKTANKREGGTAGPNNEGMDAHALSANYYPDFARAGHAKPLAELKSMTRPSNSMSTGTIRHFSSLPKDSEQRNMQA